MRMKILPRPILVALCLILTAAPPRKAAHQGVEVQFDAAAYGILHFQLIPKAPEGIDPKVAEWWNKCQPFNGIAKKIADRSLNLVSSINRHIWDGKKFSHPDVVKRAAELEQVEKERAELKKQFLAWLREGKENSYSVPLPDGGPRFLLRAQTRYTESARMRRITGAILLDMIFRDDGTVDTLKALKTLPDKGLVENTFYAAKLNIFIPSIKNGKFMTVSRQVEYPLFLY